MAVTLSTDGHARTTQGLSAPIRRSVGRFWSHVGEAGRRVARASNYLALSTLSLAELKDGIREKWQEFNDHESDVSAGLFAWERKLVDRFVRPGTRVLVIGCGSGRDVIPLVERGCQVTGIDPADGALRLLARILRKRGFEAALIEGFFEDVVVSRRFDVVIFSYYCYSYIPESRRRIEALQRAAALLDAGGSILLSYPVLWRRPRSIVITLGRGMGTVCGADWRLEDGDIVGVGPRRRLTYGHAFDSAAFETEAAAAGLTAVFRDESINEQVFALQTTLGNGARGYTKLKTA